MSSTTLLDWEFLSIITVMTNKWFHLPAALLIVVLTLIFFWKILLTNLILSGVDVFLYFYPYKAYTAEVL
ncbi:MAG TPA: hypothetical protein P5526_03145, partial [Anaerolineae bacterium]|nr:hypothetical protein [Anaerolineae bacterium]